ncbi:RagB/SusD family nutrient uptake outer membrane protein [Hymenobacter terricola]|uniref:RagB/SusD family nutrient uptake outer membrane protein n=1 Tax=Hymenobacter terricola TaxID=2819236 RepID=UPI001B30116B|nr:RagB/SusD family nutrient uptake outer membrane protein [Hymenobacter terricola]
MKSIILRSTLAAGILLAAAAGLTACKDYLDVSPDSLYTNAQAFSSVGSATSAVVGAYDMLSGDTGYGTRLSMYYPYDTDEMQGAPGAFDGRSRSLARYTAEPSNPEITNPFNNLYQGIERTNICIESIPKMALYTTGAPADTAALHRLYGEVLTLRAQYYFELIRNWGDVPAPFVPSFTTAATGGDLNSPNADRLATYDHLLADLLAAEKLVPWRSQAGAASERITKGAVKALRARIALYRGGYALHGLQMTRPADYLTYYAITRQECLDLMNRRTEHTLNPSFFELFKSFNELRTEASNEVIFQVAMGGSSISGDSKIGYYSGPLLSSSTIYGSTQAQIRPLPTYFYAFDSTDVRRNITLTTYSIDATNNQKGVLLSALTDGKFRRDWRVPALTGNGNYLGYNWPLIRFADVLLMFAEVDNEINGPTPAAVAALREVRTRAFGGSTTLGQIPTPATKADMFTALVNERFLEFGGEGIRKYDLIRWNLLDTKITEARANLTKLMTAQAPYTFVPATMYYRVTGGQVVWARSFYRPSPATVPTGTTAVAWRTAVNAALIANVASEYVPGRGKELFPYPQGTVDTNKSGGFAQNAGY